MKQALLIRFGGLGDLLVALPSIRYIRSKHPNAKLILACREDYGLLFREAGLVDEIVPEDSRFLTAWFSEAPEEKGALSDLLRSFDLVLGWTHGRENHLTSVLNRTAPPAGLHIIHADPRESGQLSRFFFRKTAEMLGVRRALPIDGWARLLTDRLPKAEILDWWCGAEREKRFVTVHPGSGSESKRWPLRSFLQIIGRLGERGIAGALVTGEAEEKLEPEIERSGLPQGWIWVRRPGLMTLASLLSETRLYLGNDSGVTHLAAACGAEIVALFRGDLASVWEPLGRVRLHIGSSLSEIELEPVWKTVASRLPGFSADSQIS